MPTDTVTPEADMSTKVADLVKRRKRAMIDADVTGTAIAEQLGIRKQSVSKVINGVSRSARVEAAIADACNLPIEELFPEGDEFDAAPAAAA